MLKKIRPLRKIWAIYHRANETKQTIFAVSLVVILLAALVVSFITKNVIVGILSLATLIALGISDPYEE